MILSNWHFCEVKNEMLFDISKGNISTFQKCYLFFYYITLTVLSKICWHQWKCWGLVLNLRLISGLSTCKVWSLFHTEKAWSARLWVVVGLEFINDSPPMAFVTPKYPWPIGLMLISSHLVNIYKIRWTLL